MTPDPHRLHHLFGALSDGTITPEEHVELKERLRSDASARWLWFVHQDVDAGLHEIAQSAKLAPAIPYARSHRPSWRPWAAAAAGLAFGFCGASMVWAYALPNAVRSVDRAIPVLSEGFEKEDLSPSRGFPRQANEWSGDVSAPVTAESGVAPIEGDRMARLGQASPSGRRFSYAWRILDLTELSAPGDGEMRKLEVSAAFNTSGGARPLHYQIRLAAFSQEPGEVRQIWNHEPVLFDTVLQHVGRNVIAGADQPGWQTVRASMEIPPGTRCVLLSLAASEADSASAPKEYYLDDVQARLVVSPAFKN